MSFQQNYQMDQRKIISDNLTTLAKEHPKGIELTNLEDLYQVGRFSIDEELSSFDVLVPLIKKKFHSSLVAHLLKLASPSLLSKVNFPKRNKEDGSYEMLIQIKSGVAFDLLLNGSYKIDAADIVPNGFEYQRNPLSMHRENPIAAQLSLVNSSGILYIQPEESINRLEQLMKELNQYYTNPISDQLWIRNVTVGLACISEHQNQLYRVLVKDCDDKNYLIEYVDYGQTKVVAAEQFCGKYLLNYFASMPIAVIPCRLANVNLAVHDNKISSTLQTEINEFCQTGSIFVQFLSNSEVNLYNLKQFCLNDLLRQNLSQRPVQPCSYDPLQDYEDETDSSNYQNTRSRLNQTPRQNSRINKAEKVIQVQQRPSIENNNASSSHRSNSERYQRSSSKNRISQLYNNLMVPQIMHQNKKETLIVTPKIDAEMNRFIEWMDSSSHGQSLWRQEKYSNALLKYLASIYNQKIEHMKKIFDRLTDEDPDAKELDLLNRIIQTIKYQRGGEKSLKKWEEVSRIERHLKEIKCILNLNLDRSGLSESFHITNYDRNDYEIDYRSIRAYLDFGCGNGEITAAIGNYLNLKKNQIFGADVFDPQNPKLTFISIDKKQNQIRMADNSVDLITCFVTLHRVPDMKKTIEELTRILRSDGFLIVHEHNCETQYSIVPKYLNYVHAIMMIAKVEEFANVPDDNNRTNCWEEQKKEILQQTKSIQYRTSSQWDEEFLRVGFQPLSKFDYDRSCFPNPQHLFYGVYRLNKQISFDE